MKQYPALNLLDPKFHYKINTIKFGKNETFNHFLAKCLLCYECKQNDWHFITEAIFLNKKRADILVLNLNEAWEILGTETKEMFNKKKETYPLPVRPFIAKEVIKTNLPKQ